MRWCVELQPPAGAQGLQQDITAGAGGCAVGLGRAEEGGQGLLVTFPLEFVPCGGGLTKVLKAGREALARLCRGSSEDACKAYLQFVTPAPSSQESVVNTQKPRPLPEPTPDH